MNTYEEIKNTQKTNFFTNFVNKTLLTLTLFFSNTLVDKNLSYQSISAKTFF
jgi:hypothetical protein